MASHAFRKTLFALSVAALALTGAPRASSAGAPATFAPNKIANLAAWFDPSQTSGVTQTAGALSVWKDLSGHGNSVVQTTASLRPHYTANGINGLASVTFNRSAYLLGTNGSFSSNLFNESTVFVVSNQSSAIQSSSILWSGEISSEPRWNLRLSENGASVFDFDNGVTGRMSVPDVPSGPALWTAGGSLVNKSQYLRKNGATLSTGTGYGKSVTGSFPLVVGAKYGSGKVSFPYGGELGEILIFSRALTASEAAQVEGYLACKWGVQDRLPANHPYRNSCPQGGSYPSLPQPAAASGALVEPQQVRSSNGTLEFNVVASQAANGRPQLVYNGSNVPPTLRLLPGDTLIVNLTNELPKAPSGSGYLNDTSLHYHGLQVSPNAPGDDSIDMLALPGQTLHYRIAIPSDHPSGLYWYHSHAHGEAERQNLAGMSGALIIDGIASSVPQVANLPERILIVRDKVPAGQALPAANGPQLNAMFWAMQHGSGAGMLGAMSMSTTVRGSTTQSTRNPYVDVNPLYHNFVRPAADGHCESGHTEAASRDWTLDDQTRPTIAIRPGEQQFWRLVNAGSDTYLDVSVDDTQMKIVALDGVPLASVGNAPLTVSHYVVPPASRIEFIVAGPPSGKTEYLRTACFDAGSTGLAMPAATLATIDSAHSPTDAARRRERTGAARGAAARATDHTVAYMRSFVKTHAIARTQTLTYSSQDQINGQSYDPAGPPQFYAQSGTMEQWQIVNVSSQVHTFHIHQTHFLVKSIVGGTPIEQSNVGEVIDNINVPAATANGPGSVTLVMDFTDPRIIGTFLLHCHILSHEDMGMMSKIRVGTAPPLLTSAPAQGLTFASVKAPAQKITVKGGAAPYSVSGCTNVANAGVSGATVTVTPAGAGSCVLVVADKSGLTANVAIAVTAARAVISISPNSLAFASPSAASQNATLSGGKTPYGVTGCAGIASATISNATLGVRPSAVGSCTLTVTDSAHNTQVASVSVNAATTGYAADSLTFHQNNARQGWNRSETSLTTANVNANGFGMLKFLTGTGYGKVYAQPLYASNESIGGTKRGLVLVATATDRVYAYDQSSLATVWTRNFTNSAAKITQQSWTDIGCRDVNPDIGIVGTPVIDRALDRMFVVVPTKENGAYHMRLHAISLQNGADAVTPVEVSASVMLAGNTGTATTSAYHNFNRAALLEANGNIYVALGSHCDAQSNTTHGWVLAYKASSLAPSGTVFNMTNAQSSSGYLGVPWGSGFGPAADSSGNVYFSTGNGPWDGVNAFSMSDIKVPGDLNIGNGSWFTQYGFAALSQKDSDLASGGIVLLPDGLSSKYPHLMIQGGKTGQKYMLDRDRLGGLQQNDAGAVWQAPIAGGFGGPAFFQNEAGTSYLVYGASSIGSYAFDAANASLSLASQAAVPGGCLECRNGGAQPIVSSNGTDSGTAIIWALQTPRSGGGTISLLAWDASQMKQLYAGTAGGWHPGAGVGTVGGAMVSPLVANGKVFVPTDGGVAVFGLK